VLKLSQSRDATLLAVKVSPGARQEAVLGEHDGALKVAIAAPAQRGKANRSLIHFLAELLQHSPSQIAILRGHASREKLVAVSGLNPQQVQDRIAPHLNNR
jgi:uncharacterized protein (TIGR00251 family)